jgi:DNA-binding MarR family transcriptional regulator
MVDVPLKTIERLSELAEFRYQMREFLSFSETASAMNGVAAQQYQLMQVIASIPAGERASITYLADRMFLQHNSAVELVGRAERAGLVKRESDSTDLRRSLVTLTEEGANLLESLVAAHLAQLDAKGPELIECLERLLASGPGRANGAAKAGAGR